MSAGGGVIVGYSDGKFAMVEPATGTTVRFGQLDTAALGGSVVSVLVDQLLGDVHRLFVAGRLARKVGQPYEGFTQEIDLQTMRPVRSRVWPGRVVQDIDVDPVGGVEVLLSDESRGSVVVWKSGAARPLPSGPPPDYFVPLGRSVLATAVGGKYPTLTLPGGRRLALGKSSAPGGLVALPHGALGVLLGDANVVLLIDPAGASRRIPVPDLPYAALADGGRLLVASANGSYLTAIDLASGRTMRSPKLDWGLDFIVKV